MRPTAGPGLAKPGCLFDRGLCDPVSVDKFERHRSEYGDVGCTHGLRAPHQVLKLAGAPGGLHALRSTSVRLQST